MVLATVFQQPVGLPHATPALRGGVLLGALMVFAAGCVAPPPQNDRESWSCERTSDGNDWACNQQLKRYRVSGAPAGVTKNTGHAETAQSRRIPDTSRPMPARDSGAGQAGWRATLPLLSAGVADVLPVSDPSSTDREESRPPPEPEPVLARWEKAAAAAKTASGGRGQAPRSFPEPDKVPAAKPRPVAEPGLPEIGSRRIYTVQIGAFTTDQAARAYIALHGLGKLSALAVEREMRGQNEYALITFGRFEGQKAAVEAWRSSGAPRDLKVWVRPVTAVSRASPKVTRAAD